MWSIEARAHDPDVKKGQSSWNMWAKFRSLGFIVGTLGPLKDCEHSTLKGMEIYQEALNQIMTKKEMSLVWGMVKMGGLKVIDEEGSTVCH